MKIRFYFDFISHNAWLAWTQIHPLAGRYGCEVVPVPVLFAGLLDAFGQRGPAEIPAKNRWMLRNVLRKASELGLRTHPPASHPFNPLLALRAASLDLSASQRRALIDGLFRAVWSEGLSVSDPGVVGRIATAAGADGAAVMRACAEPAVKSRLREATAGAVATGVFGVPTMCVGEELFWGYDDLPWLERFLAGTDPLSREELQAWEDVPATARRPAS